MPTNRTRSGEPITVYVKTGAYAVPMIGDCYLDNDGDPQECDRDTYESCIYDALNTAHAILRPLKMSAKLASVAGVVSDAVFARTFRYEAPDDGDFFITADGSSVAKEGSAGWSATDEEREILTLID